MATHSHPLPHYLPRRRAWQFALGEAGGIVLVLSAWLLFRFGHDAVLVLRDDAARHIALICGLSLVCLYGCDLYEAPVLGDWQELWRRLPLALGALALVLAGWEWMQPGARWGWRLNGLCLAAAVGMVVGFRLLWRIAGACLRRQPTAVVIGDGVLAQALYSELRRHGELGWRLGGCLSGPHPDVLRVLAGPWRGRLLATFPGGWPGVAAEVREALAEAGCQLEEGSDWYERLSGKVARPEAMEGMAIEIPRRVLWAKRYGDALLAATALVVSAPVLALVALCIRVDSAGPVIFRQRRIGRAGRPFTIYKFRTMRHSADAADLTRPARDHDPRCTRVGRWLRRLRLDELPQLVNILRGEMSLVGPRPFVPEQEEECCRAIAGYRLRWSVPPGATGWAQVNRGYCASLEDNREKLGFDLFYIQHLSLGFDLAILFETLKVVCLGRGGR